MGFASCSVERGAKNIVDNAYINGLDFSNKGILETTWYVLWFAKMNHSH